MKNWLYVIGGIALLVFGIVIGRWMTPTSLPRTERNETVAVQDEDETEIVFGIDESRYREMILAKDPFLQELSEEAREVELAKRLEARLISCAQELSMVIQRRLDGLGVKRCSVFVSDKSERVTVRLASADEVLVNEVENCLMRVSKLSFHLVPENETELVAKLMETVEGAPVGYRREGDVFVRAGEGSLDGATSDVVAFGRRVEVDGGVEPVRLMFERQNVTGRVSYRPRFICCRELFGGQDVVSADVVDEAESFSGCQIGFTIRKGEPAARFGDLTSSNIGRQLAIVVDGELISSPMIRSRIETAGCITGAFSQTEANQLAADLNAGAMPVPLKAIAVHAPAKLGVKEK